MPGFKGRRHWQEERVTEKERKRIENCVLCATRVGQNETGYWPG